MTEKKFNERGYQLLELWNELEICFLLAGLFNQATLVLLILNN